MGDEDRVEALARHLARADGHYDDNMLVSLYEPQELTAPHRVFGMPKDPMPVWQAYADMAKVALAWMDGEAG